MNFRSHDIITLIVYDDKKANLLATTHYSLLITWNTNTEVYNHGIEKCT